MKVINQKYIINALPNKVWEALTNQEEIKKWSGANAEMDENIGTNFKLWNGDIFGKNIEVIKNKKLVQRWYSGKWNKPSIVTFNLKIKHGKTEVELIHKDVPEEEISNIEKGWKEYYMIPLKELVEKTI